MTRHMIYSIAIIAVLVLAPLATNAATFVSSLKQGFGGRVLRTDLSGSVNCIGMGIGPITLTNNSFSLGNTIPFYANISFSALGNGFVSQLPQAGDWILGEASIIPNFTRCFTQGTTIPFPVRDTSFYGTSR